MNIQEQNESNLLEIRTVQREKVYALYSRLVILAPLEYLPANHNPADHPYRIKLWSTYDRDGNEIADNFGYVDPASAWIDCYHLSSFKQQIELCKEINDAIKKYRKRLNYELKLIASYSDRLQTGKWGDKEWELADETIQLQHMQGVVKNAILDMLQDALRYELLNPDYYLDISCYRRYLLAKLQSSIISIVARIPKFFRVQSIHIWMSEHHRQSLEWALAAVLGDVDMSTEYRIHPKLFYLIGRFEQFWPLLLAFVAIAVYLVDALSVYV